VAEIPARLGMDRIAAAPADHPASPHPESPALAPRLVDSPVAGLPKPIAIATHRGLVRLSSNIGEGYCRERNHLGLSPEKNRRSETGRREPDPVRVIPKKEVPPLELSPKFSLRIPQPFEGAVTLGTLPLLALR
jgi:hypothetical protein